MKRFLLNQPDTITVEDLCEKVARRHVLEQLYPEDDDETAFHEISSSQFDSLVSSLNNLSTSQEALKKQVEAVSKRLDETPPANATANSNRGRGTQRGNFRGRNSGRGRYQSRGQWSNRGNYQGNYGNVNQNWQHNAMPPNWNTYQPQFQHMQYQQQPWQLGNNNQYTQFEYYNDPTTAVSSPIHCRTCNAFGHTAGECDQKLPAQYGTQLPCQCQSN